MSILDEGYSTYIKRKSKCPVCGCENTNVYITESGIGIVEDYYICDNCSYFNAMCYSKPIEGILENYDKQYTDKVKDLELNVMTKEEYYRLPLF